MFFFLVIYGKYCAKNKTTTLFGAVVSIAIAFENQSSSFPALYE